jgi:hypothetical protein
MFLDSQAIGHSNSRDRITALIATAPGVTAVPATRNRNVLASRAGRENDSHELV